MGVRKILNVSSGYVLERKNLEEHDASNFRLIQSKCEELYDEDNQINFHILLVLRIFAHKFYGQKFVKYENFDCLRRIKN